MKVRVMSDLHMNFSKFDVPIGPEDTETVLLLAGDVCEVAHGKEAYREFFKDVTERFKLVLFVFGNHEYYDTSYIRAHDQFMRECGHLDKLKVLDMDTVDLDGVRFIGCTLWSDFEKGNPLVMHDAKSFMNDYNLIRVGNHAAPYARRLLPKDTLADHYVMRRWVMEQTIQARLDGLTPVVITHHHPSFESVVEKFKGNNLNGAYCSDMADEVFENGPNLWVCGHMHHKIDYMINKTRVLCNPRGYHSVRQSGSYSEETYFDPMLTVEV